MGARTEALVPKSGGRKRNRENFRLLTALNSLNSGNDSHSVSRYSKIRRAVQDIFPYKRGSQKLSFRSLASKKIRICGCWRPRVTVG